MNTTVNNYYYCCYKLFWRVVFALGPFTDVLQPVIRTPQYKNKKAYDFQGEPDVLVTMTVDEKFVVRVKAIKDSHGNVAKVDGVPVWATDNTDVLALAPSTDGMSCEVKAVGMIGGANVQMTADADLGPGVKNIIGTLLVDVSAGVATVVELETDPPTPQ